MVKIHDLKCVSPFFEAAWCGLKTFEGRLNDRNFQEGDWVELREYDVVKKDYTGRKLSVIISYILNDPRFCLPGYVIFAFVGRAE